MDNTPKTETSPKQETTVNDGTHKVVKGDTLWEHCKTGFDGKKNKDKLIMYQQTKKFLKKRGINEIK